jgi:hypothetical protein
MPIIGHDVEITPEVMLPFNLTFLTILLSTHFSFFSVVCLTQGPEVFFTIASPEYNLIERMPARQTLLHDPNTVHVYEELNHEDGPKQALEADHGVLPPDTQRMIWDYLDVGHSTYTPISHLPYPRLHTHVLNYN